MGTTPRIFATIFARLNATPLHIRLLLGFGLVLTLCAAQSFFAFRTAADMVNADLGQQRHEQIASVSNEGQTALLDMEAGYRGYLLSGDDGLLASYRAAALSFSNAVKELQVLSDGESDDVLRWQTLERRVSVWEHDIIEPGLALRRVATVMGPGAPELATAAMSHQDIDGIQRLLDGAIAAEQADLVLSRAATTDAGNRFLAVLLWGTLAVFGVGLPVGGLSARHLARAIAHAHIAEAHYQQMFDGNPATQLVLDIATGAILDVNPAACAFYGYARDQMLRMNVRDLNPLHSTEQARDLAAPAQGARSFERRHLLASGEARDVVVQTSLNEMGGRQVVYSIVHDISVRKQAEEALRASEERFRSQYKGFPLPTCSWLGIGDDDFVLQEYNDAAEVSPEARMSASLGQRATERFAEFPQSLADIRTCVAEQRTIRREIDYRSGSSSPARHMALTFVFVPPRTVMMHSEDITATKQADRQREAMAQSEKLRALGQMASGIAHDLNQSLMLVASYSDLARQALVQDPPDLAELEDLLTTTTQAALDGGETVKRLLLFTRAAPELDSKRVDLAAVVREAAQLTAPRWRDAAQAEGRPISLSIEASGHPDIQGSPARLRELLTNLIFNAVDALPTGGVIRLRVAAEDGLGLVEVMDSGLGMSVEVQARIFEPFFTTKGERGTGLGLAMVFGIVEQHGGHIEVLSAPAEGTTFRMTFPLAAALAEVEPHPGAPVHVEAPPQPMRVLAVDDEPMITRAVARMLRPSGHQVSVAASGEEALQLLAEQPFDVVVSDMGMGAGMNGWELADAVRDRWPGVRFLLATGWGAALDPAEARTRGVEAILNKPYHPVELLQALARTDIAA